MSLVSSSKYEDHIEQTLLTLHHERPPELADTCLIEYDPETDIVTSQATLPINGEGETETLTGALTTYLPSSRTVDEDAISVLKERDAIIEYG